MISSLMKLNGRSRYCADEFKPPGAVLKPTIHAFVSSSVYMRLVLSWRSGRRQRHIVLIRKFFGVGEKLQT